MQKNTSINNKILFDIFNNEIAFPELNADSNKAVIFITDINKHKRNLIKLYTCLSNREKEQANKYRNVLLADRYVVAHGILRYILSYYVRYLPESIQFTHNRYGKPFLENSNIHFNMSHSHNIVCYGIALNNQIGIDIELCNDNLDVQELAHLVFTKKEFKYLSKDPL